MLVPAARGRAGAVAGDAMGVGIGLFSWPYQWHVGVRALVRSNCNGARITQLCSAASGGWGFSILAVLGARFRNSS